MNVRSVEVTNIKGITHLVAKIGAMTIISGRNGEGKSSFLDALSAPFIGGHEPSLIRKGADKGEVVITLDDAAVVRFTITEKASTLKITTGDGAVVKSPATYIKSLATSFAFDPISFLDARTPAEKEKRLKFLLDAMPISFPKSEIVTAAPIPNLRSEYTIEEFDALRQGKRDERTTANGDVERLEKSSKSLKLMLPEGDSLRTLIGKNLKDYQPPANEWKAKAAELQRSLDTARANLRTAIAGWRSDVDVLNAEVGEWEASEIDRIRREANQKRVDINAKGVQLIDEERKPLDAEIQRIAAELATAQERAEADSKASGLRESVLSVLGELDAAYGKAADLDKTVKSLDDLRKRKLEALPVEGVEIRKGDIFYKDIPFDHVNFQQRIFTTFEIVSLKLGALPLMVIDNFEALDPEHREMFTQAVAQFGYQVIAAAVADSPLEVVNAA